MASLDTLYNNAETRGDIKVKKVFTTPLSQLYIEPGFNIRYGELTVESVQDVIDGYLSGVPMPPLVVEIQKDGRLKIVAGHRRFTALTHLVSQGYDQFSRVEVRHVDTDPISIVKYMVGENGRGKTNLNAVDLAVSCQKLSDLGCSPSAIAGILDFSESKVNYHLTIAKMSNEVKDTIVAGKIAADFAADLFRKGGDKAVLDVIAGAQPEKKVTRKTAGLWRPSMGKSVVSMFADVQPVQNTDNSVTLTLPVEKWEELQAAVKALGGE